MFKFGLLVKLIIIKFVSLLKECQQMHKILEQPLLLPQLDRKDRNDLMRR